MTSQRWMLAFCFSLASVLGTGDSATTTDTQKYTCRTFGSGVFEPFNGLGFYVRSNCPFTLTRFTHNRVECDITIRRDNNGLLVQLEIIINKVRTVVQNGSILVERKSVSLPYDHTYQHIFHYGIYTKLRSALLPLSVTWHSVPGGIDTVWVELEQDLSPDMTGLCGKHNISGNNQQLIKDSMLADDTCKTKDPVSAKNAECQDFFSYISGCLQAMTPHYLKLCYENIHGYEKSKFIRCAFHKEIMLHCENTSPAWNIWRTVTKCEEPTCPGDLDYKDQDAAFVPSCSNPNPSSSNQELISSCVCPKGTVLNDHADDYHCVSESSCPCVFAGQTYSNGEIRSIKCQSCMCHNGQWQCSQNSCPSKCVIEGQFMTTFDGKQYVVPGKCTYMASQGPKWLIIIVYSQEEPDIEAVYVVIAQHMYKFSHNMVTLDGIEITETKQSDHVLVFWQSSLYVHIHTAFGMKIQVQVSPKIQLYITPPKNHTGEISGLCGNSNKDTTDDFTTGSGIIENSAQEFALSWAMSPCTPNIPSTCINTNNEIFADEKCAVLNDPTGIFAKCHSHIPTDHYHTACIQRTCTSGSSLPQCLCVALGSYAKACASLGVVIGDWRKATDCTLQCQKNQEFSYSMKACNHTCLSLSSPDPSCGVDDDPVEGCGCPDGTHLNQEGICVPKSECTCRYNGGSTSPGSVVINGQNCICENGELHCSPDCGCRDGKVCVHCSKYPVNTAQKTCASLSKPMGTNMTCDSGCYCPHDQYEDHRGNCVSLDNCTCVYSGKVFSAGQHVITNCRTCVCRHGQWLCRGRPCPGKCQVYGNGHYQTFDSKWYRFDGQCQYTLVEDDCGSKGGTFSVRVESVPCCDEALTCSRSIILDLKDEVTLTLSDMRVTRRHHAGWILQKDPLYTTHTVGLYTIISVPSRGITLIWDRHTRITIELHAHWRNRVCGLCGNFDSNEMNDLQISGSAVMSSPLAFGNSWKAATPPCSDVTTEIFPCERNSYCSAWAQRRCMIITGDTFKECHFRVDPDPYYRACVQESCSCEFEGKFLGFCTAVAAYAEACSDQDVCVKWRTPDLCPVYCDYYNEQNQCSWHYEACGKMLTCGKDNYITHKLEGCYPRCTKEAPYFDENTGECTIMRNCTCYFNDTIIQPGTVVVIGSTECRCENGTMKCSYPPPTTATPTTTPYITTTETSPTMAPTTSPPTTAITNASTTTEYWSTVLSTTATPTTTPYITTTETSPTMAPTTSPPTTAITNASTTTEYWSTVLSTTATPTTTPYITTTETSPTMAPTTSPPTTAITNASTTTEYWSTVLSTTATPTTTPNITTTETSPTMAPTTSPPTTAITNASTTTEYWSTVLSTTATPTTTPNITTTETSPTMAPTTSPPTTAITNASTTTEYWSTVLSTTATPTTTPNITTTETSPTMAPTTSPPTTASTNASTTTENWSTVLSTTATPTTTPNITTTETSPTMAPTTSPPTTAITNASTTTEYWSTTNSTPTTTPVIITGSTTMVTTMEPSTAPQLNTTNATTVNWSTVLSTTATPTTTPYITTTETSPTMASTTSPPTTAITNASTTTEYRSNTTFITASTEATPYVCECVDLKTKERWYCGEMWTEDCFHKECKDEIILLTTVDCAQPTIPNCPRDKYTAVSDGCCGTYQCDCQCELFGDPHYISFAGLYFSFQEPCTYILVEEQSPRYHLTIAVDNYYCFEGLDGTCAKGIILEYQKNTATLSIIPDLFKIQVTLNNMTIEPPYSGHGMMFETTGFIVSISIPEIRSNVSLSLSNNLVVSLGMEYFQNNTQGQCGVCGGGSCIRSGGQIEDDSCCGKTAYDWVYADPLKPACDSAPRNVPCHGSTTTPSYSTSPTTQCSANRLCDLLNHPVFSSCSKYVDLNILKGACEFDSCRNGPCSSLEQAVEECKSFGFCFDWRELTNGSCNVTKCPEGLFYRECADKLDDFCYAGKRYPGSSFRNKKAGCFCPPDNIRAGNHSNVCVTDCPSCKGPSGEPRWAGEVWESGCNLCTCNNQTFTEVCVRRPPPPVPRCAPNSVLVNTSCCGAQTCVEKTCSYHGQTHQVGERWKDAARPCVSFSCSTEGIQTETKVCPAEECQEEDRIWDDQHCCFTCNQSCAPKVTSVNVTVGNCVAVVKIPVCQGHCASEPGVVFHNDLQVEQKCKCCQEWSSERRRVTLQCLDLKPRVHNYQHITSCECSPCSMLGQYKIEP
ncbi:mucin-2-like [Centropristis striata]|uniref:mucin-2-like n=1 Tax=Centropristis striata TaxID=184440 RepID=UPI0027E11A6A|nr:mucin-2-like [Centropristis striata]